MRMRWFTAIFCWILWGTPVFGQTATDAKLANATEWTESNLPDLVKLYRHFHTHPELSFQEVETSKRLASEWRKLGFAVTESVGQHGIVGLLENGEGPTLMLRCDMDALPITEDTNLVYASKVKVPGEDGVSVGVMHACGHDIHMTNLTGVAKFMTDFKDAWRGTLMLVGQPAEERGAGAKAMLKDGLFSRFPKPDYALALHVFADKAAGTVGYRAGYALANVDSVDITIKGAGGHGAYPHATVDPVIQAAELVVALQTIVSREVNPIAPAVVTVGSIHGGTKHNVIGNSCHLQLTVRSYADEVREAVLEAIKRKALAVAMGHRAPEPEIKISEGTPSLENDQDLVEKIVPVFRRVIGDENVTASEPSMGGEDFSRYGRAGVPIFMFALGTVEKKRLDRWEQLGQTPPSLHSSKYYPDVEPSLVTGISCMAAAAMELLPRNE